MRAALYKMFMSVIFAALCVCYCLLCIICFRSIGDTEDDSHDLTERSPKQRRIETTEEQHFFTSDRKLIMFWRSDLGVGDGKGYLLLYSILAVPGATYAILADFKGYNMLHDSNNKWYWLCNMPPTLLGIV
jgi:hypothetical protein